MVNLFGYCHNCHFDLRIVLITDKTQSERSSNKYFPSLVTGLQLCSRLFAIGVQFIAIGSVKNMC